MLKRKNVQVLILSTSFILLACLLGTAISLTRQKPINKLAKPAGVPGLQVTVVNKSEQNAKPVSVVTDAEGVFDFGILPAGTYSLNLQMTDAASKAARDMDVYIKQKVDRYAYGLTTATVTVEGTSDGTVTRGWDFKQKKSFDPPDLSKQNPTLRAGESTKAELNPDITFTADGKQKVKGKVHDTSMTSIQNMR